MKAIEISSKKKMVITEHPKPVPQKGEVLIHVYAAGVNRADVLQRKGKYPVAEGISDILGLEVSGIIEQLGAETRFTRIGDKVCALTNGGGYAEYVCVPETQIFLVPDDMSFIEAASFPECLVTVWSNIFEDGKFRPGDKVLVHGGASGIGVYAIQMIKALGETVIVTAGSDEKCDFCRTLGADLVIHHKNQDYVAEIKKNYGGVDIVLDMVGGDYLPRNIEILNKNGRHLSIACQNGLNGTIDIVSIMQKRLILTGSRLRMRDNTEKAAICEAVRRHVWPLVCGGEIRSIIDTTFKFEGVNAAHARMEDGKNIGKIILVFDRD